MTVNSQHITLSIFLPGMLFTSLFLTSNAATEDISVTCSGNEDTRLAVSDSMNDVKQIKVNVGQETDTNCSFVIPALDNTTSTVFVFDSNFANQFCGDNSVELTLYEYLEPLYNESVVGERLIADACQAGDPQYMAVPYFSISIRLIFSSVSANSIITLGTYKSFAWPEGLCSRDGTEVLVSPGQVIPANNFPAGITRLPNNLSCRWIFRPSDGRGASTSTVFTVTFTANNPPVTGGNFSRIDDYVTVSRLMVEPYSRWLDKSVSMVETILDGRVVIDFHSGPTGGAATFSWTVQAKNTNYVCPETPLQLEATVGRANVFKGVSLASGNPRDCIWRIRAPSQDHVVMLLAMFLNVPVSDSTSSSVTPPPLVVNCSSADQDSITLGDGDDQRSAKECDYSSIFPYWSDSSSTNVQFNTMHSDGQRWFFLYYAAVAREKCQGQRPPALTASDSPKNLYEPVLSDQWREDMENLLRVPNGANRWLNGTEGATTSGSECRWQITAEDGQWVKVTVHIPACRYGDCEVVPVGLHVYDLNGTTPSLIPPQIFFDRITYTRKTPQVLLVFDRSLGVAPRRQKALNVTYEGLPIRDSTGTASQYFVGWVQIMVFATGSMIVGVWVMVQY